MSVQPSQTPGLLARVGLTPQDAERWVWAIEGERRLRGAAAVARVLQEMGGPWVALGLLARMPGAGLGYGAVARCRCLLSRLWGDRPPYG